MSRSSLYIRDISPLSMTWIANSKYCNTVLHFLSFFNFLFWNNVDSHAVIRNNTELLSILHPVSLNGNILHNYSTTSPPGNWHWRNPLTLFRFHLFYMYLFVCVHVYLVPCNFMTCWFMWPPLQSRHRTVPSQGCLMLPFYSLSHLFPSFQSSTP